MAGKRCRNLRKVDCDECCVNRSEVAEGRAKRNGEDYIYPSYRDRMLTVKDMNADLGALRNWALGVHVFLSHIHFVGMAITEAHCESQQGCPAGQVV